MSTRSFSPPVRRLGDSLKRVRTVFGLAAIGAVLATGQLDARSPVRIGTLPSGPVDGITDVPGVRVAHVTKIEGEGPLVPGRGPVRTGATAIVPNADTWENRVAAGTFILNGNGEMTGTHWIDEAGFLETPIVFTDTLDVGRADDGVVEALIAQHPEIGIYDDVPLPVVAECDDQGINDMQGRHVSAHDVAQMVAAAKTGDFARGDVGAGTGMRAFGFKAGIGSASRVLPAALGGYTVGVLVNANTGSRDELHIDGVDVGRRFANELLPVYPRRVSYVPHGRAADGSIVVAIATNAPLDAGRLREVAKRAALGIARTGFTSHVSSGDLFVAFSTTHVYPRRGTVTQPALVDDEERLDTLFSATADAAESAVYDALFSARTMTGASGVTYYALPFDRVKPMLPSH